QGGFVTGLNTGGAMRQIATHSTAPMPSPVSVSVAIVPSVMRKIPGKRPSHGLFPAGMYCREFDSMAATPGTWAARLADWISDAPGQVRSCTHRNMPNFCAAAARIRDWLCPLHAL